MALDTVKKVQYAAVDAYVDLGGAGNLSAVKAREREALQRALLSASFFIETPSDADYAIAVQGADRAHELLKPRGFLQELSAGANARMANLSGKSITQIDAILQATAADVAFLVRQKNMLARRLPSPAAEDAAGTEAGKMARIEKGLEQVRESNMEEGRKAGKKIADETRDRLKLILIIAAVIAGIVILLQLLQLIGIFGR